MPRDQHPPGRERWRDGTAAGSDSGPSRRERAQTSIDFAIGIGVFLMAVTAVIAFTPTMVEPFEGSQQDPLVADRLVLQVTDQQIAGDAPGTLNATCTMHFFNESPGPGGSDPCTTFAHDQSVHEKLGIDDDKLVNVSLQANVTDDAGQELLCGDGDGDIDWGGSPETPCGSGEEVLAVGPSPPDEGGSVTVAKRVALLDDETVYVVVRVW